MILTSRLASLFHKLLPVLLAVLCLWATVPYGSVAFWAWASVVMGAFSVAWIAGFTGSHIVKPRNTGGVVNGIESFLWLIAIVALLGWVIFQLVPLPLETFQSMNKPSADLAGWLMQTHGVEKLTLSLAPELTRLFFIAWVAYIGFIWLVARWFARDRKAIEKVCIAVAILGLAQSLIGIMNFKSQGFLPNEFQTWRFSGTFSGPNTFGGFLAITIPVTFSMLLVKLTELLAAFRGRILVALNDRHLGRKMTVLVFWLGIALIVQVIALMLSASRGATIAMFCSNLVFLVWFAASARKMKVGGALLGITIIGILGILIAAGSSYFILIDRIDKLNDKGDLTFEARQRIWDATIDLAQAYPAGVGAGAYRQAITRFQPEKEGDFRYDLAHNDYLQLWAELGTIGMIPIALIVLLLFWRFTRLFRLSTGDPVTWATRGAFCGVLAGLLHAGVDFNLSSRPGVTMVFALTLALFLGGTAAVRRKSRPRPAEDDSKENGKKAATGSSPSASSSGSSSGSSSSSSGSSSQRRRRSRSRSRSRSGSEIEFTTKMGWIAPPLLLIGLGLAGFLSYHMIQGAMGRYHVSRGWVASGGERSAYHWLATDDLNLEEASHEMNLAIAKAPKDGYLRSVFGQSLMMRLDNSIDDLIKSRWKAIDRNRRLTPAQREVAKNLATGEAYETTLQSSRPTFRDVIRLCSIGVQASPWRADTHSLMGLYLCKVAMRDFQMAPEARKKMVNDGLLETHQAMVLAPNDITVLLRAMSAWSAAHEVVDDKDKKLLRDNLKGVGKRIFAQGAKQTEEIVNRWHEVDIDLLEVAQTEELPALALMAIYRIFLAQSDYNSCLSVIGMLRDGIDSGLLDTGLTYYSNEENFLESLRQFIIREESRWNHRLGNFGDYVLREEERREYWLERVALQTASQSSSAQGRYLDLDTHNKSSGLPAREAFELAQLKIDNSDFENIDSLILSTALGDTFDYQALGWEQQWWAALQSSSGFVGPAACLARGHLERGEADESLQALLPLTKNIQTVPSQFQHRIHWLDSLIRLRRNERPRALEALQRATRTCSIDPTVLFDLQTLGGGDLRREPGGQTVSERIDYLTPDHPLRQSFLGESVFLEGISIGRRPSGAVRLRTYWRFWKDVPSGLRVRVYIRSNTGFAKENRWTPFTSVDETATEKQFRAGAPATGGVIVLEEELQRMKPSYQLLIMLFDRTKRIHSDDGLFGFETWDWYTKATPIEEKTTAASIAEAAAGSAAPAPNATPPNATAPEVKSISELEFRTQSSLDNDPISPSPAPTPAPPSPSTPLVPQE